MMLGALLRALRKQMLGALPDALRKQMLGAMHERTDELTNAEHPTHLERFGFLLSNAYEDKRSQMMWGVGW